MKRFSDFKEIFVNFLKTFWHNGGNSLFFSLLILVIYRPFSWSKAYIIGSHAISRELPLVLLLLLLFYFPHRRFIATLFGAFSILILYMIYDVFGSIMKRAPRLSDLENVNSLFGFSPILGIAFYASLAGIALLFLYLLCSFIKNYPRKQLYKLLGFKLFLLTAMAVTFYSGGFRAWVLFIHKNIPWQPMKEIRYNGRFMSLAYDYYASAENYKKLQQYREIPVDVNGTLFGKEGIAPKRNIYIVVLESFMDPRLIEGVEFNRSPLFEGMSKYLKDDHFSRAISVTYGGGTAQAEFEVLSAVPAYAQVKSIDFNVLEGRKTSGFISYLKEHGYSTYANIATTPRYFNSENAYTSLGFEEMHYLESEGFTKPRRSHIFDGTLFDYTLRQLGHLSSPYVLYTLGMYGHVPIVNNHKTAPDLISVNIDSPELHALANQFYYRTKALSEYIDAILEHDSSAIIYVTSDHLPHLQDTRLKYAHEIHVNICLLIDGERGRVDIAEGLPYYKMPHEILKLFGHAPREIEDYKKLYFRLIIDSLK